MNRQALIDRISDTFCVEPDYLWSKSSDAAVFARSQYNPLIEGWEKVGTPGRARGSFLASGFR